ncbi:MAG: hypothetical protein NVV73_21525 [Cellvibrionaceae bacterium]|nr:hypothetical protein [Cellvibrionaceae bacterium]
MAPINSFFLSQRSSNRPISGAHAAIINPGIARTIFTSNSACTMAANVFSIAGSAGAMVAPAMTVMVLASRRVILRARSRRVDINPFLFI